MGLKQKRALIVWELHDVQILLLLILLLTRVQLWAKTPTRERLRMTNDMINQVFWCILFPVLGRGGHSGDVELG